MVNYLFTRIFIYLCLMVVCLLSQLVSSNFDVNSSFAESFAKTVTHSEYPPLLKVKSTQGYLPELSEVGTTVRISPSLHSDSLQILVDDADLKPGMPAAVYQYILTGYGAEKFAVDQRGYLYLNDPNIDADTNSSTYRLHVQAREVDTKPLRSSEPISITIHVTDINDNPPTFPSPVYMANVSANDSNERTVIKVEATDLDAGKFGKLTYRIGQVINAPYQAFRYDENTNELKAIGPLTPGEQYQVVLEAIDSGGLMGKAIILVSANDGIFNPYKAAHMGTSLEAIAATADQSVSFPQPISRIQPASPLTIIRQPISQENSITSAPSLPTVLFTPTGLRRTTPEESSETIQTMVTEINEATPAKAIVAILGDDETRSKVYFSIVDGNEDGKFAIDEETGKITTVSEFDREQKDMYTLQIEARSRFPDQSLYWTILQVAVTDVNDNKPEFIDPQPIMIHLSVDDLNKFGPNMRVGQICVRDLDANDNGRVTLRIVPPLNRLFAIDNSGKITVNGEFTTEHFGKHKMLIIATDHGNPPLEARTSIYLDIDGTFITQAAPIPISTKNFASQIFTLTTLSPIQSIISSVKTSFPQSILPPTWSTSTTSKLTFQSLKPSIGQTKTPFMPTLPVPVPNSLPPSPRPSPPAQRIAPIFSTPVLSVMVEENESDLELATVEAHYPDGQPGSVTYVMQAGDHSLFNVSSYTGTITLLKPLDAEANQEYVIKIGTAESIDMATDDKLSHIATITVKVIDVNDWIPSFETNSYAFGVSGDTEPGTIIGQVAAFDQDRDESNNKIHYRLVNSFGMEEYFAVNAENGLITLSSKVIDFVGEKITLRIEASDEGDPPQMAQVDVVVDIEPFKTEAVTKVNSNSFSSNPLINDIQFSLHNYTASIYEAVRPPYLVQTLTVLNKPTDTRFIMCSIISGNYRGAFSVLPGADGNCELRTQMQLDRETDERYLLNITVTSGYQTDFALVSIIVLDANDNAPRFIFNSNNLELFTYFAGVSSTAGPFTRILTVKAEDADLGNNSVIQYELDPLSVDSKFFTINKWTGEISTKQNMNHVILKNRRIYFEMRVIASDSPIKGQQLSTKAEVIINVVSDQHRFITFIRESQPQQMMAHETDMIDALRQYMGLCTLITQEKFDEVRDDNNDVPLIRSVWYAVNPSTKKICKKQEYRKLFESSTLEVIAGKTKPWFILERLQERSLSSSHGSDVDYDLNGVGWFSTEWKAASTVLIILAAGIAIVALIGICAVCYYFSLYRQKQSNIYNAHHPIIHQMPKYRTFYLSSGGTVEKDKIYETQILELPISDENFTMKNSSVHLNSNEMGRTPQRRIQEIRDEPYEHNDPDNTQSIGMSNGGDQRSHGNNSHSYGCQHSVHDEGDFSIEESMYAINTPGRIDPVTKQLHAMVIPVPDYPQSNSSMNRRKSFL